jgi:hypothetical protein
MLRYDMCKRSREWNKTLLTDEHVDPVLHDRAAKTRTPDVYDWAARKVEVLPDPDSEPCEERDQVWRAAKQWGLRIADKGGVDRDQDRWERWCVGARQEVFVGSAQAPHLVGNGSSPELPEYLRKAYLHRLSVRTFLDKCTDKRASNMRYCACISTDERQTKAFGVLCVKFAYDSPVDLAGLERGTGLGSNLQELANGIGGGVIVAKRHGSYVERRACWDSRAPDSGGPTEAKASRAAEELAGITLEYEDGAGGVVVWISDDQSQWSAKLEDGEVLFCIVVGTSIQYTKAIQCGKQGLIPTWLNM